MTEQSRQVMREIILKRIQEKPGIDRMSACAELGILTEAYEVLYELIDEGLVTVRQPFLTAYLHLKNENQKNS